MLKPIQGEPFACDSKEHGSNPPPADYFMRTQFYVVSFCAECVQKMFQPTFITQQNQERING